MNAQVNRFVENLIAIRLARLIPGNFRFLPRGVSFYHDLKCDFPAWQFKTIFDVGAHEGESISDYRATYRNSNIYAFEPTVESFQRTKKAFKNDKKVFLFNFALGAESATGILIPGKQSSMNRVEAETNKNRETKISNGYQHQTIEIRKLDDIVTELGLNTIDILKIDTEGFEIDVLKGGSNTLSASIPCFVHIEAGMYAANSHHCSFESITEELRRYDYQIYAIYDQAHEWVKGAKQLRRANLVFISKHLR